MRLCTLIPSTIAFCTLHAFAQQPIVLQPTPAFAFAQNEALTLRQPALPNHPFTVTGRSGAILGMQDGTVELWQLPTKFFSALHLRAEVDGYPVPIELNPLAAELEVSPDHTTITYSHAAITVRQHMFVPAGDPEDPKDPNNDLGGQILFEIHSIHPATLIVSLTPALIQMWPAPQWGQPGWDWRPLGSGGAYAIGTDNPRLFGMIGMPNATPGPISPYQEHPNTLPIEFRVRFDPARDANHLFPLLCEVNRPGEINTGGAQRVLLQRLVAKSLELPQIYARTQAYYAHFFDHRLVPHTPDAAFDKALQWAELAIDKSQATIPAHNNVAAETGLVAGWFPAFDSARPGFGWFFGRDTLWSMYAIDSEGDAALARRAFAFLIRRQRADGKMPHEFSETAESLTGDMAWDKLPYEYAAADATPLFLLAMQDYVRATGDRAFLTANWDALQKAYMFERTHDSDGDGVYDNEQGTGWVEGWPPQLPHQELYLAALDRDATRAFAQLAAWAQHPELAQPADSTAQKLDAAVAAYHLPSGLYAFSKNADGTYDPTETIYPAVAFWGHGDGLPQSAPMLDAWAGEHFETGWGARALADDDPTYDPISYHQGTVWPLFTGWNAMAQYRADRPLAGYAALRQNLELTWAQDPGAVTEVISGRFYQPLGRSSTHQLWSSAMVLAPAVRELFGVEPDAANNMLYVHPHLPPTWSEATLQHVRVGPTEYTVTYQRQGAHLRVVATSDVPGTLCLVDTPGFPDRTPVQQASGPTCTTPPARTHTLMVALAPVELSLPNLGLPTAGAETVQPHVLGEQRSERSLSLTLEALAGSSVTLHLTRNGTAAGHLAAKGGVLAGDELHVNLPQGSGWTQQRITLSW